MSENEKYNCASEKKDNGGPAFPGLTEIRIERGLQIPITTTGMSMRDWFAGIALQGYLSAHTEKDRADIANESSRLNISPTSYVASVVFKIADAMLIERNK